MIRQQKWWQTAVGYEIYPASFYDSNGDGIGDLKGIIAKLDYLKDLGINLIWVCPFFKSPRDDNGYDISDYYNVDPVFGQTSDMKLLIDEAHKRNIKIIFDFVLNHTSDEHSWFIESRSSEDNPKRNYYIWQKGSVDEHGIRKPPNNWRGFFTDSAWAYDQTTDSYYMKIFSKKMPDLNWDNLEVRQAIFEVARFYLNLGVDGFRLDAIAHLARDNSFKDSTLPPESDGTVLDYHKFSNLPQMFDYLKEFKQQVLDHYDALTVGEVGGGVSPEGSLLYSGFASGPINMVFNFDTAWENGAYGSECKKDEEIVTNVVGMKQNFKRWFEACYQKSWLPLYWNNHDHPRVLSQYGSVKFRKQSAKMLATVLLFMYGTPFLFNGEEIGMSNVLYDSLEDFKDVSDQNFIKDAGNRFSSEEELIKYLQRTSRTNGHAPMQWNNRLYAGFSSGKPWLKINPNYLEVNVESQLEDKDSILNFYKKALKLRAKPDILNLVINTPFKLIDEHHQDVFAYFHQKDDRGIMVIANFRPYQVDFTCEHLEGIEKVLLKNYREVEMINQTLKLPPFAVLLLEYRHG